MPVWFRLSNVIPLTHFLLGLIIENGTFSKPPVLFGAWLLLEQFAGFYPILLCILKEKCFGSLNIYFKSKRHKIMPLLLILLAGYILIFSISLMLSIFLFAKNQ
jgi:hypothetical protein